MSETRVKGVGYDALRYFLAGMFLIYGAVKLAGVQFDPPRQPHFFRNVLADDLTGMQLVWRFFGYSRVYHCFVGLAEILAAVLLFSRRTATLGALVFLPIIANVVVVDLCFGVETDATFVAIALLIGDAMLLVADRARVQAAIGALVAPAETVSRKRVAASAALALGIAVSVVAVAVLTEYLLLPRR